MKRRPPRLRDEHWLSLEILRKRLRTRHPVEVRVVRRIRVVGGDPVGATVYDQRRRVLVIYIKAGRPFAETSDTITHEFGHALAFPALNHGAAWGRAFARAYRTATGAP